MAFQALAGNTFIFPTKITEPAHLWIVITEPTEETEDIVIVNVTSRKSNSDTTITLNPGHHSFIRKPSVVNYSDAMFSTKDKIDSSMSSGEAMEHDPINTYLLKRIRSGIIDSKRTPLKIKDYCRKYFDTEDET